MTEVRDLSTGKVWKDYPDLDSREAVATAWEEYHAEKHTFFKAGEAEERAYYLKEGVHWWSKGNFWAEKPRDEWWEEV